jgi:hypothetical protein
MLTRGGVGRIGGAVPDRALGPTSLPALGSGGAERGILTPGIRDGMPTGVPTLGVIGAIGTNANALALGNKTWDNARGDGRLPPS